MIEKNWRWKKLAFVNISKNQHQVPSIFIVMFILKCYFIDWKISIEIEKSKLAKLFYLFYRKFYHKWDFFQFIEGLFIPFLLLLYLIEKNSIFKKKLFVFFVPFYSQLIPHMWTSWYEDGKACIFNYFTLLMEFPSLHDSCMLSSKT